MNKKHKPYVICIVGDSGSGKTTFSRIMDNLGVKAICSYTTRKIREGEVNNIDHIYVTQDEFNEIKLNADDPMTAYTDYGGYEYCTVLSQFKALDGCCYVVDEAGVNYMLDNFYNDLTVIPVLISCGDKAKERGVTPERILRDSKRDRTMNANYEFIVYNTSTIEHLEQAAKDLIDEINTSMFK